MESDPFRDQGEWSGDPSPRGREPNVGAGRPGDHWRTVSADETEVPDFRTYTHLYMGLPYMGTPTNLPTTFDPLLRKVADFETAGVILAPRKLG